jgi:predicted DNA-binding protein
MDKKVIPFNQAKMNIIREPIDEQYINQMGEYENAMKKRLGYKKGGKVKLSTNMDTINLELSRRTKKAK